MMYRPFLALAGLIAVGGTIIGTYAVVSPGGEEQVLVQQVETPTPVATLPLETPVPSVTLSPLPSPGSIPCPAGDCSRIAMRLEGPTEARPGDLLVYRLKYEVNGVPGTDVVITWSNDSAIYESSHLEAGTGSIVGYAGYLRWSLGTGAGILAVSLQVPMGSSLGAFTIGAYEPGTETTESNTITTTVVTP